MIINNDTIKVLKEHCLPINMYFILYCIKNKLDWYKDTKEDKVTNIQYLVRRKFITYDLRITTEGEQLLDGTLPVPENIKKALNNKEKEVELRENFNEFWDLYPTSDKFKHWKRTRALRVNKALSFKHFCSILEKKEYSYLELKNALLTDIKSKEETSIVENQFRYMQALPTWLSKGIYEGYISEDRDAKPDMDDRTIFE